jgi:hypothetical protein
MADAETPTFDKRKLKRLKEAKAVAERDVCIASNVDEFEFALPCELLARSLCQPAELSAAVVERALRKHLHEAGSPEDPVERKLHRQYFRLDLLAARAENLMMGNGEAGFKNFGPVVMRLNKEARMCGESLIKMSRESRERSVEKTPEAFDPDAEDAKYLAEKGPLGEAAELAAKQAVERAAAEAQAAADLRSFAAEKAEWDALSSEQRAEFVRFDREEKAHWADPSAPKPRPLEVGYECEFFNFIRYLAYESFSDAEREEVIEMYPSLPLDTKPGADALGPAGAGPIPAAGDPPKQATAAESTTDPDGERSPDANGATLIEESAREWSERLTTEADEVDAERALIHARYAVEQLALYSEAI